jgi:hypothetical protein
VGAVLEEAHNALDALCDAEEAARRWGLVMALTLAAYHAFPSGFPAPTPAGTVWTAGVLAAARAEGPPLPPSRCAPRWLVGD